MPTVAIYGLGTDKGMGDYFMESQGGIGIVLNLPGAAFIRGEIDDLQLCRM